MAKTDKVVLTLDELKAENAAIEAEDETTPQVVEDEPEIEAVEEETEKTEEDAETSEDETEETEIEDWMKPDGHTQEDVEKEKKFTDSDIGKAKAKLRAKLERKHESEVEKLRAEVEKLKTGQPQPSTDLNRPKREDFYDNDDPEGEYLEALADYKVSKSLAALETKQASTEVERKNLESKQAIERAVDRHYEEAVKLAKDSGISAESYQNADYNVRSMVNEVFPDSGDIVVDALISKMGKGSEKVMYALGVSDTKRAKLKDLLQTDTSGMSAAMYLGQLIQELGTPRKRKTNAPKPATEIKGDVEISSTGAKKKYDEAHAKRNGAEAFKVKQAAKKAGIDVSDW